MSPDFDKLIKILVAEREDGCRDRVVIGGLDSFLAVWIREATAETGPASQSLVAGVTTRLQEYAQKPITERVTAIRETLKALQTDRPEQVAEKEHKPGQAEVHRTKPRRPEQPAVNLTSPVSAVKGMGSAQARRLERLGVRTINDLIYLFPRRYDDFSQSKTINQLQYGEEVTIIGVVQEAKNQKTRKGIHLTKAVISDGTGAVEAVWFNQPYMARQLRPGRRVVLSGVVDQYLGRLTFQSPQWEPWKDKLVHTGRLVPVYPLTEGLSGRRLRTLIQSVAEHWAPQVADCLPSSLRRRYNLVDVTTAIRQIHFPDDWDSLAQARHRLCFDEFLLVQLGVLKQRLSWQQRPGRPMAVDHTVLNAFSNALPFTLTSAQQRVLREITNDLQQPRPMSRLLQGDVGSGKTVVALAAMLVAVANGMQAVMMAPTEILAEQHHRTLTTMLQGVADKVHEQDAMAARLLSGVQVGLLVGSLGQTQKEERHRQIAAGELGIVVGTHALIQEGVIFKDLGLAIIDEQHRFGVAQRAALRQKGHNPHVLVMSATPIPRTLALTIYGDLDISTIDELPPHRQKVITKWLAPLERERSYAFLRGQVETGRQAFIICPLIEESERVEAKAAVSEYKRLQDSVFPDLRLGLLHGRMGSGDKEEVMTSFRQGEYDVLVTTPVVEVGIDVPNATVMLVEGADRFGLAQLHQFRGRVGRGAHQSYCLLLAESPSFEGEQRLQIIETTDDGFLLAEEDLKMRGPGEFFGTRQSGLPDLRVAKLGDVRVLEEARRAAQDLFREDPTLSQPEHQLLARKVREFWGTETDLI
jgi:ATP-dependent DNA helicase RecG